MYGATFKEHRNCGVGLVNRNEKGQMMGTVSKKIHYPLGALEVEAKAIEEGILFAWDLGLKNILLEGDSLAVIQPIKGASPRATSIQKIIEGLRWCLKKFNAWKAVQEKRSSNT